MSQLNFNDLPCEMMAKVFRLLDGVNLKNATLTCQLWNNLVTSECRWSLKLQCDSDRWVYNDEHKTNFILTTNRKFGTITIVRGRVSEDIAILKILQRHGFNMVRLILSECRIGNLNVFAQLLNFTPNLKHAAMQMKDLCVMSDVILDDVLPDLKELKSLEMWASDFRILKCFRKAKLTTMEIVEDWRSKHYDQLVDFLSVQEMLSSLTVTTYSRSPSICVEMGKLNVPMPFQLTQLAISDRNSSHDQESLLRFVKSQAMNLKKMEIGVGIHSSVYECVFASLTLNSLSVLIDQLPRDFAFYERLKENNSICTLKLLNYGSNAHQHIQFLRNFLEKLPKICNLVLPQITHRNKHILLIPHLSKLQSLCIDVIDERLVDCVKFPNLTTLHIGYLWGKINWNKFTKVHPRLTDLTIVRLLEDGCLTSNDMNEIMANVDLQTIRLGIGFVADDRSFDIIRTKCSHLKVLDLHKSCVEEHRRLTYNQINVLRLCDDIKCLGKCN